MVVIFQVGVFCAEHLVLFSQTGEGVDLLPFVALSGRASSDFRTVTPVALTCTFNGRF